MGQTDVAKSVDSNGEECGSGAPEQTFSAEKRKREEKERQTENNIEREEDEKKEGEEDDDDDEIQIVFKRLKKDDIEKEVEKKEQDKEAERKTDGEKEPTEELDIEGYKNLFEPIIEMHLKHANNEALQLKLYQHFCKFDMLIFKMIYND